MNDNVDLCLSNTSLEGVKHFQDVVAATLARIQVDMPDLPALARIVKGFAAELLSHGSVPACSFRDLAARVEADNKDLYSRFSGAHVASLCNAGYMMRPEGCCPDLDVLILSVHWLGGQLYALAKKRRELLTLDCHGLLSSSEAVPMQVLELLCKLGVVVRNGGDAFSIVPCILPQDDLLGKPLAPLLLDGESNLGVMYELPYLPYGWFASLVAVFAPFLVKEDLSCTSVQLQCHGQRAWMNWDPCKRQLVVVVCGPQPALLRAYIHRSILQIYQYPGFGGKILHCVCHKCGGFSDVFGRPLRLAERMPVGTRAVMCIHCEDEDVFLSVEDLLDDSNRAVAAATAPIRRAPDGSRLPLWAPLGEEGWAQFEGDSTGPWVQSSQIIASPFRLRSASMDALVAMLRCLNVRWRSPTPAIDDVTGVNYATLCGLLQESLTATGAAATGAGAAAAATCAGATATATADEEVRVALIVENLTYDIHYENLSSWYIDPLHDALIHAGYPATNIVVVKDGTLDEMLKAMESMAKFLNKARRGHATLIFRGHARVAPSGALHLVPVNAGHERKEGSALSLCICTLVVIC
jgi:hypothetical protein